MLLGLCMVLTFKAQALLQYTQDTAAALHDPRQYVLSVMGTKVLPGPTALSPEVQP
jgi:multicomponent K+:H+ antiporter subunit D